MRSWSSGGSRQFFSALADLGGATEVEPETLIALNTRYGLEVDPDSIPGLVNRFGVRFPGEPI